MKYDSNLTELKRLLPAAQNILVVLPKEAGVDHLASGLALYLSLKQHNKFVVIASEKTLQVAHTNLFGVDNIQTDISASGIGNFVLTIGGAVDTNGKAIFEKVDYSIVGPDLKLVFPIVPGHRFEATHITPKFEGGNFDLIFSLGAPTLSDLGNLYTEHQDIFASAHLANINNLSDSDFGTTKILDPTSSSVSEIVGLVLPSLGLPMDGDISTNLLTGIYQATANLQNKTSVETFEVIASCLRNGGQRQSSDVRVQSSEQPLTTDQVQPEPITSNQIPATTHLSSGGSLQPGPTFDFTQMYQPSTDQNDNFTLPQVVDVGSSTHEREPGTETTQSGFESEATPEEDWLTPKIFSGKQLG